MPSTQVHKLGPERLRIPQSRGMVRFIRTSPFIYVIGIGFLHLLPRQPGGEHGPGLQWLVLLQVVIMAPIFWWASRLPLLAIHERGIVFPNGRRIITLRWDEARVGFAKSVSGRLLIRPNGGPSARSLIAVDIPPEWVDAVAEAIPKSEASADAPTQPAHLGAMP